MIFARPPAGMILAVPFIAGTLVGYFLLYEVLGIDQFAAVTIGMTLGCIGAVLLDLLFRKSQRRTLWDVGVSSFFDIVPTWLAGVLLCIALWVIFFVQS